MSRALLEFGGSGDIQRDVLNGFPETELPVTGASRGDQLRHVGMTLQAPEALDGFEDAGGDPPHFRKAFETSRITSRLRSVRSPRSCKFASKALTYRRVLGRSFPEAERVFRPIGTDPERHQHAMLADAAVR